MTSLSSFPGMGIAPPGSFCYLFYCLTLFRRAKAALTLLGHGEVVTGDARQPFLRRGWGRGSLWKVPDGSGSFVRHVVVVVAAAVGSDGDGCGVAAAAVADGHVVELVDYFDL